MPSLRIEISEPRQSAARSVAELLGKLRIPHAFVGEIALQAWLGGRVDEGPVDVLALVSPEGMRQVPMMASHRGFLVDENELDAAHELDLIPMRYGSEGEQPRVHVLMASNALYAKMVGRAVPAALGEGDIPVVDAEDLGIMLALAEDPRLGDLIAKAGTAFDPRHYNETLHSIGLGGKALRA